MEFKAINKQYNPADDTYCIRFIVDIKWDVYKHAYVSNLPQDYIVNIISMKLAEAMKEYYKTNNLSAKLVHHL